MIIVLVEGLDKSGKSTLIRELHKATRYEYPIVDRFTGSTYAYGMLNYREIDYSKIFEFENQLSSAFKVLLVYVTCNKEVLAKRFEEHKETDIELSDIEELSGMYEVYLSKTPFTTLRIDTSKESVEKCVQTIVEKISEMTRGS